MSDGAERRLDRRRTLGAVAGLVGVAGCLGSLTGGDGTEEDGAGDASGTPENGGPGPAVTDLTPVDCEGETVSEDVTSDTTWSVDECPRVELSESITVTDGATLSIEPGVEVVGSSRNTLKAGDAGTLEVAGDPTNPVWFRGQDGEPGSWSGVEGGAGGSVTLDNAVVEHGGKGSAGTLTLNGGSRASITNTLIRRSKTRGLAVKDGAALEEFANNAFRENDDAGLTVPTSELGALDRGSAYAGNNGRDVVSVSATTVESEATWAPTDAPYLFSGYNHALAAPVTVEPGAHVRAADDCKLSVESGGSLTAEGESDGRVVFEGATAEPNFWQGIVFDGESTGTFENVVIAYGGKRRPANLTVKGTAAVTVTDSTLRGAQGYGIYVGRDATLDVSNNTFEDNTDGDVGGPGATEGSVRSYRTNEQHGSGRPRDSTHER